MNIRNGTTFLLAIILLASISVNPAYAHRFYVALVIPLSGAEADQGRQYRHGFMLATTERDSHPEETSDGHLGGLDVYVSVVDALGDINADIADIKSRGLIEIVVVNAPDKTLSLAGRLLDGSDIALLRPGQSPFSRSDMPAVAAFASAFESQYGDKPSAQAALGYNAARRIDLAVRAQGGADDIDSLTQAFKETANGFAW